MINRCYAEREIVDSGGGRVLLLSWNSRARENVSFAERFEAHMVV
jgi:hypothetical protein